MISPEEYHQEVGGRIRRDKRKKYEATPPPTAGDIRQLIIELKGLTGMNYEEIADSVGCSRSTIGLLSQRRAGDKLSRSGISTTQLITERIKMLLQNSKNARNIRFSPLNSVGKK